MVAELLTSERLCLSRDQYGATPLHKAVLYYQPKLVKLIADKFRIATRAKDQVRFNKYIFFSHFTCNSINLALIIIIYYLKAFILSNYRKGERLYTIQPLFVIVEFSIDIS